MKHNYKIDLLRMIACFSVVVLHVSSQNWYTLPVTEPSWIIMNAYDALSRFGVPIFIMISGMLFLDRERKITIKRLLTHNVLRLFITYLLWSGFYGIRAAIVNGKTDPVNLYDSIINGYYHLWFLPMICVLYLLVPMLRAALSAETEKKILQYMLAVFFAIVIIPDTLSSLNIYLLGRTVSLIRLPFSPSYLGYFLLGYYLYNYPPQSKIRKLLLISAVPSAVLNIAASSILSRIDNTPTASFYDSFSITTCCISAALFVLLIKKGPADTNTKRTTGEAILSGVSACTLGIYLLHPFCIETLNTVFSINTLSFSPVWSIPLISLAVFLLCLIPVAIVKLIPGVRRYVC